MASPRCHSIMASGQLGVTLLQDAVSAVDTLRLRASRAQAAAEWEEGRGEATIKFLLAARAAEIFGESEHDQNTKKKLENGRGRCG